MVTKSFIDSTSVAIWPFAIDSEYLVITPVGSRVYLSGLDLTLLCKAAITLASTDSSPKALSFCSDCKNLAARSVAIRSWARTATVLAKAAFSNTLLYSELVVVSHPLKLSSLAENLAISSLGKSAPKILVPNNLCSSASAANRDFKLAAALTSHTLTALVVS